MRVFRQFWCSVTCHFLARIGVALAIGALYLFAHGELRARYTRFVRESARLSFQAIRYSRAEDGASIVLTYGGFPMGTNLAALPKVPYDLQNLTTFQGVVSRHQAVARLITSHYQGGKQAVVSLILHDDADAFVRVPLAPFDPNLSEVALLPRASFNALKERHLDAFLMEAQQVIPAARSFDPTRPAGMAPLPPESDSDPITRRIRTALESAYESTRSITVREVLPALSPNAQRVLKDFLDPAQQLVVLVTNINASLARDIPSKPDEVRPSPARAGVSQEAAGAANPSRDFMVLLGETFIGPETEPAPTFHPIEATSLGVLLDALSSTLQDQLDRIAAREAASFWLLGRYRWWEMIAWVWFGVVVRSLIDIAKTAVKAPKADPFEPRNSLVVLAQLIYCPVLVITIIFLAGYFEVSGIDLTDLGRSTPAILGIAFVFGVFPEMTWGVVHHVANSLFGRIFHEPIRKPEPRPSTVRVAAVASAPGDLPGDPPKVTVEQLKENITNRITAPLKLGSP